MPGPGWIRLPSSLDFIPHFLNVIGRFLLILIGSLPLLLSLVIGSLPPLFLVINLPLSLLMIGSPLPVILLLVIGSLLLVILLLVIGSPLPVILLLVIGLPLLLLEHFFSFLSLVMNVWYLLRLLSILFHSDIIKII